MKIVCDTGALISLERLNDGYPFIRTLYSEIIIPLSVLKELTFSYQSPDTYIEKYGINDLIKVIDPTTIVSVDGYSELHAGEQDAICLANELQLNLIIEERDGRTVAQNAGLKISGIAGQIINAYKQKIIQKTECVVMLAELFENHRLSKVVYQKIINSLK